MKFILIIIRRWIRENIIATGYQDSRGFHYSLDDGEKLEKKNEKSEKSEK